MMMLVMMVMVCADWGKPPNSHSVDPFNDIPTSRNAGGAGQQWHTLGYIGDGWAANGTSRYTASTRTILLLC